MGNKKFSDFTTKTSLPSGTYLVGYEGSDNFQISPAHLPGEDNTASNVGLSGAGVFKQKSGADLQFRKLKAGSNITITENSNDISIASSGGGGTDSFVLNFAASHSSNNTNNYYQFRNKSNSSMVTFTTSASSAGDLYYATLIVPVACYLKTVHIKNIQTTPSATVAKMKIWKNDSTAEFTGSNISWSGAGSTGASWTQTLTSSDNSFAAGDRVDIGFNLDGTMGGVTCSMLFELT